ncbi:MAG: ferric reductase-like transmembrane domain-containing protein [Sandaracinaceae bacterium]
MTKRLPWIVYGAAALLAAAALAFGASAEWSVERDLLFIRGTAWGALVMLGLSLSATPIGKVLARLRRDANAAVTEARRALGIAAAALATLHAGLALVTWLAETWPLALELSWLRSGVLAWAILAALWITSYPKVVAKVGNLWKPLHRLAYVAFVLVLHHALLSPLAPRGWVLSAGVAVAVVGLLRLVRRRPRGRREPAGGL